MKHILSILLLLGASVCCLQAQQRYFEIEVRHPAEVALPAGRPEVHSVLVVNNAAVQPDSFGHRNKRNDEEKGSVSLDLQDAARQCVFGALNYLEEAETFDEVSVMDRSVSPSKSFYKRTVLAPAVADSLMDLYGADAIVSLNQLVLYDVLESYETDNDTYYAYLQTYCTAQWSIHYKGKTSAFQFTRSDTLMWGKEETTERDALLGLPDRRTALVDFAYYTGGESLKMLYPQWTTEERYLYYTESAEMDKALALFSRQQWLEAFSAWHQIGQVLSYPALLRAYAYADMALAAEMMGDFDAGLRAVDEAVKLFGRIHTSDAVQQRVNLLYYRKQLEKRKSVEK